jgi:hypothetical protein
MFFYGCAAVAATLRSTRLIWQWLPWCVPYLILFCLRNCVDYLRYGAAPSYHMWSGKLWSICIFVILLATFLKEKSPISLKTAFWMYAINASEGIVASLVLPTPGNDVPTAWHALLPIYRRE